MKHVIRTQVLEIITNKKEDAFELQQGMSELFYSAILPELEKIFDELAPPDQFIYLDKIELDIGKILSAGLSGKNLALEFRQIFQRQFRDQVTTGTEEKIPLPLSYTIAQQWLFYMKKGYLPWNTTSADEGWYLKVLEGLAEDYKCIEEFRALIRSDKRAVRRIVLLHDTFFLVHLVEVLTAVKQEKLQLMIGAIVEIISGRLPAGIIEQPAITTRRHIWQSVLERIVISGKSMQPVEIINEILVNDLVYPEIETLYNAAKEKEILQPFIPLFKKIVEKKPEIKKAGKEENEISKGQEKKEKIQLPEEGLFVSHAGLVLLHPFLARFFTYLGLISNNAFIDVTAKQQALVLLHYLATGRLQFEEHELVVPKCLCNYILEETVDPLQQLSAEMLNECDELLKDVIAQWTVLKNTTPEGLRVNFLQRPGKLYTKNDEPHLMVETSAFDVLLDRLPWGIGLIKLPWMEKVLRVEWR